jgi:hypothetical protein
MASIPDGGTASGAGDRIIAGAAGPGGGAAVGRVVGGVTWTECGGDEGDGWELSGADEVKGLRRERLGMLWSYEVVAGRQGRKWGGGRRRARRGFVHPYN